MTTKPRNPKRKAERPPAPASYRQRTYRQRVEAAGLNNFTVQVRETDLHILADQDLRQLALDTVFLLRSQIEAYIAQHPAFLPSLTPLPDDPTAPPVVKAMLRAGLASQVGPMAAVAGAVAGMVGEALLAAGGREVVVENGGDIFLLRAQPCTVAIFAGVSPLSNRVGLVLSPDQMPLGVCTSSATVGHSLSLGNADAITVLARDPALADAAATRIGNAVQPGQSLEPALAIARKLPDLMGAVIIRGEELGAWGQVELVPLAG
ncbi:MAG: UPF0280 family protein [Thermodesulfobacteriota bacterium]